MVAQLLVGGGGGGELSGLGGGLRAQRAAAGGGGGGGGPAWREAGGGHHGLRELVEVEVETPPAVSRFWPFLAVSHHTTRANRSLYALVFVFGVCAHRTGEPAADGRDQKSAPRPRTALRPGAARMIGAIFRMVLYNCDMDCVDCGDGPRH